MKKDKNTSAIVISIIAILIVAGGIYMFANRDLCKNVSCEPKCFEDKQMDGSCNAITGRCDYKEDASACGAGCFNGLPIDAMQGYQKIYDKSIAIITFDNINPTNASLLNDISKLGNNNGMIDGATIIAAGKNGQAANCVAQLNCNLAIKNFTLPNNTKVTFAGDFLVTDISQGGGLFSDASQSNGSGYGNGFFWIGFSPGIRSVFFNYADGVTGWGPSKSWSNVIDEGKWTSIIIVADTEAQTAALYKNGELVGVQNTLNIKPFATSGKTVYVGEYTKNYRYNYTGSFDNIVILGDTITPTQAMNLAHMSIQKIGTQPVYSCASD